MWDFPTLGIGSITLCILIIGGFLYFAKGREKEAFKIYLTKVRSN